MKSHLHLLDVNLPIRFHIPVKVLVLPQMEAVLHSPAGHRTASKRLMVDKSPTLPTYQCVGYPVAPIPGWLASILPFNPCVGSITPPLLMALMPVHPALAGKWLQKNEVKREREREKEREREGETERQNASRLEETRRKRAKGTVYIRATRIWTGWNENKKANRVIRRCEGEAGWAKIKLAKKKTKTKKRGEKQKVEALWKVQR